MDSAKLLTVRDVARLLSVSTRQVWRLREHGQLPRPVRLGGSVRWRAEELCDWLDAGAPLEARPSGRERRAEEDEM